MQQPSWRRMTFLALCSVAMLVLDQLRLVRLSRRYKKQMGL